MSKVNIDNTVVDSVVDNVVNTVEDSVVDNVVNTVVESVVESVVDNVVEKVNVSEEVKETVIDTVTETVDSLKNGDNAEEIVGNVKTVITERDSFRPARGTLNIDKAKRLLNFSPKTTLKEGISSTIEFMSKGIVSGKRR